MNDTDDVQRGREEQYRAMMSALTTLEGRYGGVRGALLKKVRAELEKLEPKSSGLSLVSSTANAAPATCRACGRELRRTGTDGTLVCMNGHRVVG